MKNKLQPTSCAILVVSLFILFHFASIYGLFGQGTTLYGIITDTGNVKSFVSFDYTNGKYDTLFDFTGVNATITNDWNTIDPYNGRYFLANNRIITIDINTYIISQSSQTYLGKIEYDMFSNKLIYRSHDGQCNHSLRSYDLNTGMDTIITSIPVQECGNYLRVSCYNSIEQQYLYITGYNYILIDVKSGTIISITPVQSTIPTDITFDISTKKYYGILGNTKNVVSIDPITGNTTFIANISNYWGALNQQEATIDSYNGLYLLPYVDSNINNWLAVVDIITGNIIQSDSFPPEFNGNKLYSRNRPTMKLIGDSLISTFGLSYQWYLNDTLIVDANSQTYTPIISGDYKVEVTFQDGRTEITNETYLDVTGIENKTPVNINIFSYPNPFISSIYFSYNLPESGKVVLNLIDLTGKEIVIFVNKFQNQGVNNIYWNGKNENENNISKGIYFLLLTVNNKLISTKLLLKN